MTLGPWPQFTKVQWKSTDTEAHLFSPRWPQWHIDICKQADLVWTVSIFRHCFPESSTCCLVDLACAAVDFVAIHVLRKGWTLFYQLLHSVEKCAETHTRAEAAADATVFCTMKSTACNLRLNFMSGWSDRMSGPMVENQGLVWVCLGFGQNEWSTQRKQTCCLATCESKRVMFLTGHSHWIRKPTKIPWSQLRTEGIKNKYSLNNSVSSNGWVWHVARLVLLFLFPQICQSRRAKFDGDGNFAITLQCCLLQLLLTSILQGTVPMPTLVNHRGTFFWGGGLHNQNFLLSHPSAMPYLRIGKLQPPPLSMLISLSVWLCTFLT